MKPKWKNVPILVLGLFLAFSRSASADVELCNKTAEDVWVALAFAEEKSNTIQAWEKLTSEDCERVLSKKIHGGMYLYVVATKSDDTFARIEGQQNSNVSSLDFNWCVPADLNEKVKRQGHWQEFEPPCDAGQRAMVFQRYWIQQTDNVPRVNFFD